MTTRTITTPHQRDQWAAYLAALPLPLTVTVVQGKKRSDAQNRTIHMWFHQLSGEFGDEIGEVKGFCKAKFGLPIMKRDCPAWVEKYSPMYGPLDYQTKIALFEILPMTRLMKVAQLSEFMDAMQRYYSQMGISLIDPDPLCV